MKFLKNAIISTFSLISSTCVASRRQVLISRQMSKLNNLITLEIEMLSTSLKSSSFQSIEGLQQTIWIVESTSSMTQKFLMISILAEYELLCEGSDGVSLLNEIRNQSISHANNDWDIDYLCLAPHPNKLKRNLMTCAIAQLIKGSPSLQIDDHPTHSYAIFESSKNFYFCRRLKGSLQNDSLDRTNLIEIWSKRPFTFSSASSIEITESIVNILLSRVSRGRGLVLMDPCCGSGTMLISALRSVEILSYMYGTYV